VVRSNCVRRRGGGIAVHKVYRSRCTGVALCVAANDIMTDAVAGALWSILLSLFAVTAAAQTTAINSSSPGVTAAIQYPTAS